MNNYPNVRWQCRRGMLELDVLFHRFVEQQFEQLPRAQQSLFLQLLQQDDPILFDWLISGAPCTDVTLQPIVQLLLKTPPYEI